MTDNITYTPSNAVDPNHGDDQLALTQDRLVDAGRSRVSGNDTPLELDTDYESSSLAGSEFLEGSWATVSSEDAAASRLDDLGSSGDEKDMDNLSELSPRHTSSAVHSESEIDCLSDSTCESDGVRPANNKTYEDVTDQSWTDPDKSTPSNSTLSTFQGSFSRGLGSARTPVHSRSSTLTREHLTKHSQYQLVDAQLQPITQTDLEDSQVELVFPRIAGEFGTGSVDTITSATPLLPVGEQSNASHESQAKQHNFRTSPGQQLSEDDYIFLAESSPGPTSRSLSDSHEAIGATAHPAFSTYPLDGRRSEKRQGVDFVRNGIDERGKRRLDSRELRRLADDNHAKQYGREQDAKQVQHSKRLIGAIPERVVDTDSDGYERLSPTEASVESLDRNDDSQQISDGGSSNPEARSLGGRANWPVHQGWLDALATARSEGRLIMVDAPGTNRTEDALSLSLVSMHDLPFDDVPLRQKFMFGKEQVPLELVSEDAAASPVTMVRDRARLLHSRRIDHVRKIVTIVALPLLVIAVMSKLSSGHQDTTYSRSSTEERSQASHTTVSNTGFVPCSAASEAYGIDPHFESIHICNTDIPGIPYVTGTTTPQSSNIVGEVITIKTATATPLDYPEHVSKGTHSSSTMAPAEASVSISTVPTAIDPPRGIEKVVTSRTVARIATSHCVTSSEYPTASTSPFVEDWYQLERQMLFSVIPVANASWATRFVEHSLALTAAIDRNMRAIHDNMAKFVARSSKPLSKSRPIRNSGRRILNGQGAGLFEETDALKRRIRSEMSDLLEIVDHHFQDLAVEVDKAIKLSRERLAVMIKDTAEAVEKHVGVEIPLPAFVARDPDRNRTKSTVSTWAEKFWQTLHHATVTLII